MQEFVQTLLPDETEQWDKDKSAAHAKMFMRARAHYSSGEALPVQPASARSHPFATARQLRHVGRDPPHPA
jgi:hypothetical protein